MDLLLGRTRANCALFCLVRHLFTSSSRCATKDQGTASARFHLYFGSQSSSHKPLLAAPALHEALQMATRSSRRPVPTPVVMPAPLRSSSTSAMARAATRRRRIMKLQAVLGRLPAPAPLCPHGDAQRADVGSIRPRLALVWSRRHARAPAGPPQGAAQDSSVGALASPRLAPHHERRASASHQRCHPPSCGTGPARLGQGAPLAAVPRAPMTRVLACALRGQRRAARFSVGAAIRTRSASARARRPSRRGGAKKASRLAALPSPRVCAALPNSKPWRAAVAVTRAAQQAAGQRSERRGSAPS